MLLLLLFIIVEGGVFWWVGWGRGSDYEDEFGLAWKGGGCYLFSFPGNGERERETDLD